MALPRAFGRGTIAKALPSLSVICLGVGIAWLAVLSRYEYSRNTYISENALLPGSVHTYFSGSEQNVFRAYREEVRALGINATRFDQYPDGAAPMAAVVGDILRSMGLKVGTQKYSYEVAGERFAGENVYAVLRAPRGDATEALVLCAGWTNTEDELNESGVALVLALARYLKRWSLWSKDLIILITADSRAGPQAWVDAYHDVGLSPSVSPLHLKSGAIQGVVVLDYPGDARFDSLFVVYEGINGQLPNLDLINTAVHIADGQMGLPVHIQEMFHASNTAKDRLRTMLRGMVNQGLGHATGPHSSFIPYHIDAITLRVAGEGRHDELSLGRTVESLMRSLNNLLEHFHQSFFFYVLLAPRRFVSVGTYLPSAMLVAVNFTFTAIALWIKTAQVPPEKSSKPQPEKSTDNKQDDADKEAAALLQPSLEDAPSERPRELFWPLVFVIGTHFLGSLPLYLFNNLPKNLLEPVFYAFSAFSLTLPFLVSFLAVRFFAPTPAAFALTKSFSLLLLGLSLSTLATLNFSLSFLVGLFCAAFTFISAPAPARRTRAASLAVGVAIQVLAPTVALAGVAVYWHESLTTILAEAAFGWRVWGMWTQVVVWGLWWPQWILAGVQGCAGLWM